MSEMVVVDAPERFPTACVCGNQSGRMVDTHIENACGHVYLCERCVRTSALAMGWVPQNLYDIRGAEVAAFEGRVEELGQMLDYERAHKLVDAQEFAEMLLSKRQETTS